MRFPLLVALSHLRSRKSEKGISVITFVSMMGVTDGVTALIMVLAVTKQEQAVRELGCKWVGEIFADRAYNDDGTLVDRALPGAVIHDPDVAGPRMLEMVRAGAIITESGKHLETSIDTICLHGDGPTAVQIARSVRACLEEGGVTVTAFER